MARIYVLYYCRREILIESKSSDTKELDVRCTNTFPFDVDEKIQRHISLKKIPYLAKDV